MNLIKYLPVAIFMVIGWTAKGQTTDNLVAHYQFDNCPLINDSSPTGQDALFQSKGDNHPAECECGVLGDALLFDGTNDQLLFLGPVTNYFNTTDFTVGFYFKPFPKSGLMDILSKKADCAIAPGLSVKYKSNSAELIIEARQDSFKVVEFKYQVDRNNCWHHVSLVRRGNVIKFYYNGQFVESGTTSTRVNLKNSAVMAISGGPCLGTTDVAFRGLIDDFRVYNRALSDSDVEALYHAPDKILNPKDIVVYLGESIQIETNSPCGESYQWLPTTDMDDDQISEPIITPTETTTFTYQVNTGYCIAKDTIHITVVDPSEFDCTEMSFPTAFTPNGDNLNDVFSFSTRAELFDELIELEIFDRWGNRVFYTQDFYETWDGTFGGQEVNPGVFLYRVRFKCHTEEINQVGKVTLIR